MNKTKTYGNQPTKESAFYMREVAQVCRREASKQNIKAQFFDSWIPDRVGVKRAITAGGVPADLVQPFKSLWKEVTEYLG